MQNLKAKRNSEPIHASRGENSLDEIIQGLQELTMNWLLGFMLGVLTMTYMYSCAGFTTRLHMTSTKALDPAVD